MQTLVKEKTNNLVYILGVITAIIFSINDVLRGYPLFFVGIGIMLVSLFFFEFDDLFLYTIILFPFLGSIKLMDIDLAFYSYYFILVAIKYFTKNQFNFKFCFSMLLFLLCVILTSTIYGNYNLIISESREIISLLFLLSMFNYNSKYLNKAYIGKILQSAILGTLISAIGFILQIRIGKNFATASFPCFVAIILLMSVFNKKISFFNIVSIILLIVAALVVESRTNLIVLLFVILIPILLLLDRRKIKYAIYLLFLMAVIIIIISTAFSDVLNVVLERFDSSDVNTGNGRTEIWGFYINLTCSSLVRFIFGNGHYSNYMHLINNHEHNSFVQVFSQFGMIGLCTWAFMYFNLFKQIISCKGKFRLSSIVPIICFIGCYMGIAASGATDFMCLFLCSCLIIRYCRMENHK